MSTSSCPSGDDLCTATSSESVCCPSGTCCLSAFYVTGDTTCCSEGEICCTTSGNTCCVAAGDISCSVPNTTLVCTLSLPNCYGELVTCGSSCCTPGQACIAIVDSAGGANYRCSSTTTTSSCSSSQVSCGSSCCDTGQSCSLAYNDSAEITYTCY